ncbi:unnamed protein product [Onchocerca ochengi]|uniref:BTB domain-containing protein n=1 Tax=Onchocerca ochengi TaxID=42157 RepID=A0A182EX31_ONCOC|nr:unnamed protein product [Onchocerca ochengi]
MEIVQIDLLDHHLICAHDLYVQMFGNNDYTQVQTQTGDDELDCYVQTEEVDKETIWTQIPYSGLACQATPQVACPVNF